MRLARAPVYSIVVACLGALIALLILFPLGRMLVETFSANGALSLGAFRDVLELPGLGRTLMNTVLLVAGSGTLALVIGSLIAWLNERTDARMGWSSEVLPVLPLMVPGIAMAIGWVFLLSPGAGVLNTLLRGLLGMEGSGPLNIFTWPGLLFAYTVELVPQVFLIVSAALRNLDAELDEASRISGASRIGTFRRVTLPAVKPALVSSSLLVVVYGFGIFAAPSIIGASARIDVLSVRIVELLTANYPPRIDEAVVLSLFMLAVITGLWLIQRRTMALRRFSSIGGRSARRSVVELGPWRWLARGGIALYAAVATVLPVVGLLFVSLQPFWSARIHLDHLTLSAYHEVFVANEQTRHAIANSARLGVASATVGVIIAVLLTTFIQQRTGFLSRFLDGTTKLPAAMPHVVLAVGLLVVLGGAPFFLGGTLAMLLIAYALLYLPQGTIASGAAVSQVDSELIEASRVTGAGPARTLRRVSAPLMLPGLAGAWALLFVLAVGDLTASALLAAPSTPVSGFVLLELWGSGTYPLIAALALIISAVSSVLVLTVLRLARARRHLRTRQQ